MPYSLAFKLTLAFLTTSLIGVVLVAVFSGLATSRAFNELVAAQNQAQFIEQVTLYYQTRGSLAGIGEIFRPQSLPPGQPLPNQPTPFEVNQRRLFALTDPDGRVLVPAAPYRPGERIPLDRLARLGTAVEIDGQVVGVVLPPDAPPIRNPQEESYLARTNRALLLGAVGAAIVALGLGIFLARTITRPVRELTTATAAMAGGDLAQTVPIRSQDELGQLAATFNRMSADLAQANRQRRQMTADIAHDLRTPLTVITGYLEALRDGDLQPTPDRFKAMYDEAEQLHLLITDLRTLSLADAGELTLNWQSTAPQDLLQRIATTYGHQAQQSEITLHVRATPGLPPREVDPEQMMRVLSNLVGNALRYTPPGGQIILRAWQRGAETLLSVQDSGAGIPPEDLPHIFDRFYRADKSRRQESGQSGLGLAIARAIVEAHGGTIRAESEPGQGTTFIISLT